MNHALSMRDCTLARLVVESHLHLYRIASQVHNHTSCPIVPLLHFTEPSFFFFKKKKSFFSIPYSHRILSCPIFSRLHTHLPPNTAKVGRLYQFAVYNLQGVGPGFKVSTVTSVPFGEDNLNTTRSEDCQGGKRR